ncbi:MAG: DUF6728 family protein [Ferruginibacter sp.]
MKVFSLIADYLYLSKKNESETDNKSIKAMHRINRAALLLFLLGITMMLAKMVTYLVLR